MTQPSITYWDYLHLLPLLDLQSGMEEDDDRLSEDELHFIVVHQVFELWFKLVLREIRMARDNLLAEWVSEKHIPHVVRHLKRVNEIFKHSVNAFEVLETLTPQDFLAFRKKLGTSSGFQSFQLRQMELLLGLDPSERQKQNHPGDPLEGLMKSANSSPHGSEVIAIIEQTRREQSLRNALLAWLERTPIQGSTPPDPDDRETVLRFLDEYEQGLGKYDPNLIPTYQAYLDRPTEADRESFVPLRTRAGLLFIESYRELPLLAWPNMLLDTVVEMEELMVLWRTRHARMVERIIGRRPGSGGSSGVSYLDATANYRIFHEFWAVRSVLIPRDFLPPLRRREMYELMETLMHPSKG